MRRLWVASAVSAGLVLANVMPAQAAMSLADGKVNMSMVEKVAKKKKKAKETCQYKLIFWCCTPKGGQEYCTIK
jgi:hypothetical protein